MSYLKRPTLGLVYQDHPGPAHGARNQLSLPRCERTVEAFSDISYASTEGYKSLQGQVYYYAGAPVMWNTNRQPFPTQSTAESELISLCEALVGGRATSALVAAIRDEEEEKLVRRLWGDNAAAISLATGEGQGSWRTRHLRIRAAILRAALHQNEWHLGHLTGRELVADSFTKVVIGPAFERALQDLNILAEATTTKGSGRGCQDKDHAKMAMLVGATLLSGAAAAGEEGENGDELSWLWMIGIILMCVGAVYVANKSVRSSIWLYKRLLGTSGSCESTQVKGAEETPQVRMLRHSSSEEEQLRRINIKQERANYVPRADMKEIHAMMAQSLAIPSDPHNKMHGRDVQHWQSDEDERQQRPVRFHTSDRLPRRRKKKGVGRKESQEFEDEDEAIARAWRATCSRTKNLFGASSALPRSPQQDQRGGGKGVSPTGSASQSGSSNMAASASSLSMNIPTSSGSSTGAAGPATILNMTLRSGSSNARADASASLNMTSQSGLRNAAVVDDPTSQRMSSRSGSAGDCVAETESGSRISQSNPWNDFQREYAGRRWGSDKMRAEYWRYKSTGKKPA